MAALAAAMKAKDERLKVDPLVGVADIIRVLQSYLDYKKTKDLYSLITPPADGPKVYSLRTPPHAGWLSKTAGLSFELLELGPNTKLSAAKLSSAIQKMRDSGAIENKTKFNGSDHDDKCDMTIRTIMAQLRCVKKHVDTYNYIMKQLSAEEQKVLKTVLGKISLPTSFAEDEADVGDDGVVAHSPKTWPWPNPDSAGGAAEESIGAGNGAAASNALVPIGSAKQEQPQQQQPKHEPHIEPNHEQQQKQPPATMAECSRIFRKISRKTTPNSPPLPGPANPAEVITPTKPVQVSSPTSTDSADTPGAELARSAFGFVPREAGGKPKRTRKRPSAATAEATCKGKPKAAAGENKTKKAHTKVATSPSRGSSHTKAAAAAQLRSRKSSAYHRAVKQAIAAGTPRAEAVAIGQAASWHGVHSHAYVLHHVLSVNVNAQPQLPHAIESAKAYKETE